MKRVNPIKMIRDDHRRVQKLFREFEHEHDDSRKHEIASEAIKELKIHAKLEEEIFYPTFRNETSDEKLVNEAIEEHHVVDTLIEELEHMPGGDGRFEAKFTVLAENVKHHIQEEEHEMLPKMQKAEHVDFRRLCEQLEERRQQLQQSL
jgi:hemerythrin superfamily protein